MKKNMGIADRIISLLLAVVVAVLYFTEVIGGIPALILGILAVAFLVTGFLEFFPLYLPFGITNPGQRSKPNSRLMAFLPPVGSFTG